MSVLQQVPDKWTVIAPIANLKLEDAVDHEFRVDRVTFVSTAKLAGRRRRFSIPWRLSELSQNHGGLSQLLNKSTTVGIVRCTGSIPNLQREAIALLRDELAILGASQLGYAKRSQTAAPALSGEESTSQSSVLWLGQSKQFYYQSRAFGPSGSLRLNNGWLNFQRQVFLFDLLKLLRGETKTAKAWREDLRRAGILIGLSQTASSVPDAFLWNMIALELLLTRQCDVVGEALPSRAEALLGWSTNWKQENFEQRIRHVYQVRCRLVHQGNRNAPTREDLFFTDDLLLCLLANLVVDTGLFESKEALVQFSKRVEAEKLLGVRPSVRPRSLRMLRRTYRPRDYEVY